MGFSEDELLKATNHSNWREIGIGNLPKAGRFWQITPITVAAPHFNLNKQTKHPYSGPTQTPIQSDITNSTKSKQTTLTNLAERLE